MVLPDVGAQVVLPVVPRAAGRTGPQPRLGVLAVDVTLQSLLVVKGLLAGLEKTRFFFVKKTSPVFFFLIFAQKREFLGFFQFQEHF